MKPTGTLIAAAAVALLGAGEIARTAHAGGLFVARTH